MENKEVFEKLELEAQELEKVSGGMSGSRKALLRDYVAFFKRKHYSVGDIKYWWSVRSDNAGISAAELEEDYQFIESIY